MHELVQSRGNTTGLIWYLALPAQFQKAGEGIRAKTIASVEVSITRLKEGSEHKTYFAGLERNRRRSLVFIEELG